MQHIIAKYYDLVIVTVMFTIVQFSSFDSLRLETDDSFQEIKVQQL